MILTRRFLATVAAALLVSPAVAAAPQKKAVDWTRTVVATPEGGFRMGNPAAKVRLVEYGSLTCGHCRHFAETGMAPLLAKVKTGKVSFEFRNFILNGIDVSATLVARCGGPARFFPIVDTMYASQRDWLTKIGGMSVDEQNRMRTLSDSQRLLALASRGGLQQIAATKGLPVAAANACLVDKAGFERVGKVYEQGVALGVNGTPTFFVNGTRVDAADWPSLEPIIRKAGG